MKFHGRAKEVTIDELETVADRDGSGKNVDSSIDYFAGGSL